MHLRSVTLRGFKSFPDRTRLDLSPGVAVVVGPNGSGKSNVTDAILWALGEQSPLAVRGQKMQDVIFGGGRGVGARGSAEVELVLDNACGTVDLPLAEISVVRRLDRSGEGEYRLNGARCRLADVQELLSDTGLGKEAHSVVSQGRVEAIVTSRPADRRRLIEEAAGLGKHRRRRHRARRKLERTAENLEQAHAIEREARRRLAPLKRQAEAAELHERLRRQQDEARHALLADQLQERTAAAEREGSRAAAARESVAGIDAEVGAVAEERRRAEGLLARQAAQRDRLAQRTRQAEAAAERVGLRHERAVERARATAERLARRRARHDELDARAEDEDAGAAGDERIRAIEAELEDLAAASEREREHELAALVAAVQDARHRHGVAAAAVREREAAVTAAGATVDAVRGRRRERATALEAARRASAAVGAELARVNQFLRSHAGTAPGGARAVADVLRVRTGAELAVAAVLDGRLAAVLADDLDAARAAVARGGRDGARALLTGAPEEPTPGAQRAPGARPPVDGATRLADAVHGDGPEADVVRRLLAGAWLVEALPDAPPPGPAILVTGEGAVWRGAVRELQRAPAGGAERVLGERNRREALLADVERTAGEERAAQQAQEALAEEAAAADRAREEADVALRTTRREATGVAEELADAERALARRRDRPDEGPRAVRAAQLRGELAAERRTRDRAAREQAERRARRAALADEVAELERLLPDADGLADELAALAAALGARAAAFAREAAADRAGDEDAAGRLRACATREAELAQRRRVLAEDLTRAEVAAQRARDQAEELAVELGAVAERLGIAAPGAPDDAGPLSDEERRELEARLARLDRRREQLGPVNPLARDEYAEAVAHAEELEEQRTDLERALRDLRTFVRDTDREIERTFARTFEACAAAFAETAAHVFPGGSGRLRLVSEDAAGEGAGTADGAAGVSDADGAGGGPDGGEVDGDDAPRSEPGVELEITPAGKRPTRLSLLSGGEKSMTAIAFLFAVFRARPCPFYVLDEVEAALDDPNIDRFLALLRAHRDTAQFIVVTHQKRTMDVADVLYGVSMAGDGVSKVVSQRLPREPAVA